MLVGYNINEFLVQRSSIFFLSVGLISRPAITEMSHYWRAVLLTSTTELDIVRKFTVCEMRRKGWLHCFGSGFKLDLVLVSLSKRFWLFKATVHWIAVDKTYWNVREKKKRVTPKFLLYSLSLGHSWTLASVSSRITHCHGALRVFKGFW